LNQWGHLSHGNLFLARPVGVEKKNSPVAPSFFASSNPTLAPPPPRTPPPCLRPPLFFVFEHISTTGYLGPVTALVFFFLEDTGVGNSLAEPSLGQLSFALSDAFFPGGPPVPHNTSPTWLAMPVPQPFFFVAHGTERLENVFFPFPSSAPMEGQHQCTCHRINDDPVNPLKVAFGFDPIGVRAPRPQRFFRIPMSLVVRWDFSEKCPPEQPSKLPTPLF